jgi:hypothetical protein
MIYKREEREWREERENTAINPIVSGIRLG